MRNFQVGKFAPSFFKKGILEMWVGTCRIDVKVSADADDGPTVNEVIRW